MAPLSRILITGATGFLGGAIARAMLTSGIAVGATRREGSRTDRLGDSAQDIRWFGTDEISLKTGIEWLGGAGSIIHTATCYGRHGESWSEIVSANLDFPLRLLNLAKGSTHTFLNIGTVLIPYTNAYALSKNQFVEWGKLATQSHPSLHFINVRLEHLYGPGDDESKFVTQMIRRCLANEPVIKLTEGRQKRDFIHIDDAIAGIHTLLDAVQMLQSGFYEYNMGSGKPIAIRELVQTIHRLTNSLSKLSFGAIPYRPGEVLENSAKIDDLKDLEWECRIPLEKGLKKLIEQERKSR